MGVKKKFEFSENFETKWFVLNDGLMMIVICLKLSRGCLQNVNIYIKKDECLFVNIY